MFHTEKRGRGRPKSDIPDSKRLVRKEVLLTGEQVQALQQKARETSERDGKPYSFTEALRDVVGLWMQREGKSKLDRIDDFMIEEILATPDEEILAEVSEEEIAAAQSALDKARQSVGKMRLAKAQAEVAATRKPSEPIDTKT